MGYVNKISIGEDTHLIEPTLYGTSSTAAETAIKDVTLTSFELIKGTQVAIKFSNTNTAAVANLKLKFNSESDDNAKPIKYRGANLPAVGTLAAGRVYNFVYDGANWELVGDLDTNTQSDYGNITTSGKIGTTADLAVYTTTGGLLTAGSLSVTDDTTVGNTAATFVAKVTQNGIGKITVTKAALPTATTDTAGITTVGASGGAAAYDHGTHVTTATVKSALGTVSTTAKKFLKDTGAWTQVDWGDLTGIPNLPTGNGRIFYGTCTVSASTATKTVTCTIYDSYTEGDILIVKFTNSNTADNPQLNVNSKGKKNIKKLYNGAIDNLTVNSELRGTCIFIYDGTQWIIINADYNTTYSVETAVSSGTTESLVSTGEKFIWNSKQDALAFDGTYSTDNKVATVSTVTNAISNLTAADLNLASALKYVGVRNELPAGTNSTTYSTYNNGDVITVNYKEYAYLKGDSAETSSWVELGDEGSYKLKQTAISAPTEATNTWASSIGQDADGAISVSYSTLDTTGTWSGDATYLKTSSVSVTAPSGITINDSNKALYGLQQIFDTTTKDKITAYSLVNRSRQLGIGYFLSGNNYNTINTAYGGWYVIDYKDPYYLSINGGNWNQYKILTSNNYTDYTVKRDGSDASGTWGISITGSAGSAATASTADAATKIAITTSAPTSSKIVGYIPFSTAITGNNDLYAQDSLYLYDTVNNNNAISSVYLNVGKDAIMGGITLHSTGTGAFGNLVPATLTESTTRTWTLPDENGTIALNESIKKLYLYMDYDVPKLNSYSTPITNMNNAPIGVTRTLNSTETAAVTTNAPTNECGGKIYTFGGYNGSATNYKIQIFTGSDFNHTFIRRQSGTSGTTWTNWYRMPYISGTVSAAIGGAKTPVYVNTTGEIVAGDELHNLAYQDDIEVSQITDIGDNYLSLEGGALDGAVTNTSSIISASGSGIYKTDGAPIFYFLKNNSISSNQLGAIFLNTATTNNTYRADKMYFRTYRYDSSTGAVLNKWDQYYLPEATTSTSSSESYAILTESNYDSYALPLTGGTMNITSKVVISDANALYSQGQLQINNTVAEKEASIGYNQAGVNVWTVGVGPGSIKTDFGWYYSQTTAGIKMKLNKDGDLTITGGLSAEGQSTITDTTDSSSPTTGALTISGGVGISENLFVGNNIWSVKGTNNTISVGGQRTDTTLAVRLHINAASTNHGVYSNGYYDGTTFHDSATWMIYRNNAGDIFVNGTATTATKISYQAQLTTQEAIDSFLEASVFKVATFKTSSANNIGMASNDGIILSMPLTSTTYGAQLAFDDNTAGTMKFRGKSSSWGDWKTVLHSGNSYAANSNGTAVTVTCGTDATLATINDVAVKINVTKPTYTASDVGAAPAVTGGYLPLSGGIMTGTITLNSSGVSIKQLLYDTSNYGTPIYWNKATEYTETYKPSLGFHNVGDTNGNIIILPYATNSSPWNSNVGLQVGKNTLKWEAAFKATSSNGRLSATQIGYHISFTEKAYSTYNASDDSIDFIFL